MFRIFILAVALGIAPVAAVFAQTPRPDVCVIQSIEGRSFVFAPGLGRRPAEPGLGMGLDANLQTGTGARVALLCDDDLRVVVGPATQIILTRIVPGGRQPIALRLLQGIAGFLFGGDGDGVQVATPSAVAAVRSTEWAMRVQNGATAVFSREGIVLVVADGATVQLGAGDGVDVTANGDIGPLVQWGQPRIDLFADLLGSEW